MGQPENSCSSSPGTNDGGHPAQNTAMCVCVCSVVPVLCGRCCACGKEACLPCALLGNWPCSGLLGLRPWQLPDSHLSCHVCPLVGDSLRSEVQAQVKHPLACCRCSCVVGGGDGILVRQWRSLSPCWACGPGGPQEGTSHLRHWIKLSGLGDDMTWL